MISRILVIFLLGLFSVQATSNPLVKLAVEESLSRAQAFLAQGQYYLALDEVNTVIMSKPAISEQSRAYGIKGSVLLLMQEYGEAEQFLVKAFESSQNGQLKAGYANSLGVLYHETEKATQSDEYFRIALSLAANDQSLILQIRLNQARSESESNDEHLFETLFAEIASIDSATDRTRYYLNLIETVQSRKAPFYSLIQKVLEKARNDVFNVSDKQLQLELIDSISDSYEKQGQYQGALELAEKAAALTEQVSADDLLLQIEWRKGRIYQHLGQDELALTAFGKAVDHVQAIRMDIPVEYEDGRSSFRETMEPIFLGYAHHLLKKSAKQSGETKQRTLQLARQTIEQIKQTELEDFLGGRCLIEGIQRKGLDSIDEHAAILYPVILPDRLELLFSVGREISQFTIPVSEKQIYDAATDIARILRSPAALHDEQYQPPARLLYQWIIAPLESELKDKAIKTLVIVPDGVLRLVPFAALYDGKQFLLEKYALSISPGMSLLGAIKNNPANQTYNTLLAGVSKFGPVIEKLPMWLMKDLLQYESTDNSQRKLSEKRVRKIVPARGEVESNSDIDRQTIEMQLRQAGAKERLQEKLSLPGVEEELNNLNNKLHNVMLLNEHFTIDNFYQQFSTKPFAIVHIATHGFFSSNADDSFLMAFDDILKLDDLQAFLRTNIKDKRSIDLLTFSACETADGDDRAPLGFAGAALKADALSALGSLWPIADAAAAQLMVRFYSHLVQHSSKAESLRQAQLELLSEPEMRHPFFWSPFILVGNWL